MGRRDALTSCALRPRVTLSSFRFRFPSALFAVTIRVTNVGDCRHAHRCERRRGVTIGSPGDGSSQHSSRPAATLETPTSQRENPPSKPCRWGGDRRRPAQGRTDMRSALALVIALLAAHIQAEGLRTTNPQRTRAPDAETRRDADLHRHGPIGHLPPAGPTHRTLGRHRLRRGPPRPARRRGRIDALCCAQRDATASCAFNSTPTTATTPWSPCWAMSCSTSSKSPTTPRCSRPTTCASSTGARVVRTGPDSFDSEEARHAGYLVRDEIIRKPGDLRMARGASLDERRLLDGSSIHRRRPYWPRLALRRIQQGDQESSISAPRIRRLKTDAAGMTASVRRRGGWRGRLRPRVSRAAAGTDGARTRLLCETPAALVGSRSTAATGVCAPPGRGCPGRRAVGAVPTAIA